MTANRLAVSLPGLDLKTRLFRHLAVLVSVRNMLNTMT